MTPVNQPEHLVGILQAILTDEQKAESFLAKLQSIEKTVADFILAAALYEIATRTGKYTKGALRNLALVTTGLMGYVLSPIDVIPDAIPVVGQVDDWLAAATVLSVYAGFVIEFSKDVIKQGILNDLTEKMSPKIRARAEEACLAVANIDPQALMSEIGRFYRYLPKSGTTLTKERSYGSSPVSPR